MQHLVATHSNILLNWKSQNRETNACWSFAAVSQKFPTGCTVHSSPSEVSGAQIIHSQIRKDVFFYASPPPISTDLPSSFQLSGHFKKDIKVCFWGRGIHHMLIIKLSISTILTGFFWDPYLSVFESVTKCAFMESNTQGHIVWLIQ